VKKKYIPVDDLKYFFEFWKNLRMYKDFIDSSDKKMQGFKIGIDWCIGDLEFLIRDGKNNIEK